MDVKDIVWYEPGGAEMSDHGWNAGFVRCLGVLLSGTQLTELGEDGNPIVADTLFLTFNAHHGPILFRLPPRRPGRRWERLLDTSDPAWGRSQLLRGNAIRLRGRSTVVLRLLESSKNTRKGSAMRRNWE